MLIRDGFYATDRDIRLVLRGYYEWKTGQTILFQSEWLSNFIHLRTVIAALEHQNNGTTASSPIQVQGPAPAKQEGWDGRTRVANVGVRCVFKFFIQFRPKFLQMLEDGEVELDNERPNELQGVVTSANCIQGNGLLFNATAIEYETYFSKAINYTLMVTFISFIEVLLLIRQMEFTNTQSSASKVSLLCIGLQAIMDSYLCLLHLTTGILVERLFNAFATAAFFKFVIFSIFEMRYLLTIWKARRPQQFNDGWNAMRRELSMLYSRFYGFLLAGILLVYQMQGFINYFVFLLYSFWVFQIVNNIQRDSRRSLHPHYVIGISASRLSIPLYFHAYPGNFLELKPNYVFCGWLCAYVLAQVIMLLLQNLLGPRFFIPARFLPEKYNYFRPFRPQGDCVICMLAVEDRDLMVTPCDHCFHPPCLQQWMDIKLECPTCRRTLPAL